MHTTKAKFSIGGFFEKRFCKIIRNSQLIEREFNKIVDEVQHRILNKYFEDFE